MSKLNNIINVSNQEKRFINFQANRAKRAQHAHTMLRPNIHQRSTSTALPHQEHTYGRALRPQTPVGRVMMNQFGDEEEAYLQYRLRA